MVNVELQRVIINPGHGINNRSVGHNDPGAASPCGKEHDVVAAIADHLLFASIAGVDIIVTPQCGPACVPKHPTKFVKKLGRSVPTGHLSYLTGVRDPKTRKPVFKGWINETALPKGDYLISLHMNAPPDEHPEPHRPSGTEVHYAAGASPQRRAEAELVGKIIAAKLGLRFRGVFQRPDLPILRDTDTPALLIEYGFITNPDDVAKVKECGAEATEEAIKALREYRSAR